MPLVSFRSRYKPSYGIGQICQWNRDPQNARGYDFWRCQFVRPQSACRYIQCRITLPSSHLASQQRRFHISILHDFYSPAKFRFILNFLTAIFHISYYNIKFSSLFFLLAFFTILFNHPLQLNNVEGDAMLVPCTGGEKNISMSSQN